MAPINTGRVAAGGMLAGVVANVCDITWNMTLTQADMVDISTRLGASADATTAMAAVPWILVDFVLGLVIVWTYAAIRPRFGPGPKTALLAALVSFVASTAVVSGFTSMGLMTPIAFLRGSLAAAVSVGLAGLAGCWLYKED